MGPLNDENRFQLDEKKTTKTEKIEKPLKMFNIINFRTICYKLASSGNFIHLFGNYKYLRPVSILLN